MSRITIKSLERMVNLLNKLTNSPTEPYSPRENGIGVKANIGNYHISQCYGGYSLHRMFNDGGVNDVFRCGHIPARELYYRICAYIDGIESTRTE